MHQASTPNSSCFFEYPWSLLGRWDYYPALRAPSLSLPLVGPPATLAISPHFVYICRYSSWSPRRERLSWAEKCKHGPDHLPGWGRGQGTFFCNIGCFKWVEFFGANYFGFRKTTFLKSTKKTHGEYPGLSGKEIFLELEGVLKSQNYAESIARRTFPSF